MASSGTYKWVVVDNDDDDSLLGSRQSFDKLLIHYKKTLQIETFNPNKLRQA